MSILDTTTVDQKEQHTSDHILREEVQIYAKDFKRAWVGLGQHLNAIYQDKLYRNWGYDKFETYIVKEVGLKKPAAMKLLKSYLFLEEEEPTYLKDDFFKEREAPKIPGVDEVNVLRLAKNRKELYKSDYDRLKRDVFDKGHSAAAVRQSLTNLIKERKQVDPEEERHQRNQAAIRRLLNSLRVFKKDMAALKLVPAQILKETDVIIKHLEDQLD